MEIENLKRWHWMLLGLLFGLAFAYAWQGSEPDSERHLSQAEFEREVLSKSESSKQPLLQKIVVYPAIEDFHRSEDKKVQLVTGMRLRFSPRDKKEVLVPFAYIAKTPYTAFRIPPGAALKPGTTVVDYLAAIQKSDPELKFRIAWEASPKMSYTLWGGGGVLVIGIIWPTILNLLIGAGLGRGVTPKAAEYDMSRFGKPSAKTGSKGPAAKSVSDEDRRRLDALNAALEVDSPGAGVVQTAAVLPVETEELQPGAGAIRPLTEAAAEPVVEAPKKAEEPHETMEEIRERYAAGIFYPVARGPGKEE